MPRSTLRGSGSARYAAMRARIGSGITGSRRSNMGSSPAALLAALRGERALTRRLELIARFPAWHGIGLCDQPRRHHVELRVLDHAVEVPAAIEPVAGLMVFLELPLLDLLPSPACWPADVVGAVIEEQCRHAYFGERELIGAVVVATVGKLVRLHHPALRGGDAHRNVIQRGLAERDERGIARAAEDVAAVDVD